MYVPRLRRMTDVLEIIHEEYPLSPITRHVLEYLIYNKQITSMKYGDAWLINIDELFKYFTSKKTRSHKLSLPLKKNMKTAGQIFHFFKDGDENTIIRKPNLRRFCNANGIHKVIDNPVHKPLYDFNDFLMKVNPKGIAHQYEMPNVMILAQAVNEFQSKHPEDDYLIDRQFIATVRATGGFFIMRRLRFLYLNYDEFEKVAESLLEFSKSRTIPDYITNTEITKLKKEEGPTT